MELQLNLHKTRSDNKFSTEAVMAGITDMMGQVLWTIALRASSRQKIIYQIIKVPYYWRRVEVHLQIKRPNTKISTI